MNTQGPKLDPFDQLLETYAEELIAMPDDQALAGADPSAVQKEGLALLDKARDAAGRRRLDVARAKLAKQKAHPVAEPLGPRVSPQEARRFLAQVANDGRFTLAARELKDMSDEEALRLYEQFKRLEGQQTPPSDVR